jgi:glutamate carboxypeptidase
MRAASPPAVALVGGGTAANVIPQHAWFSVDCRVTSLPMAR